MGESKKSEEPAAKPVFSDLFLRTGHTPTVGVKPENVILNTCQNNLHECEAVGNFIKWGGGHYHVCSYPVYRCIRCGVTFLKGVK